MPITCWININLGEKKNYDRFIEKQNQYLSCKAHFRYELNFYVIHFTLLYFKEVFNACKEITKIFGVIMLKTFGNNIVFKIFNI